MKRLNSVIASKDEVITCDGSGKKLIVQNTGKGRSVSYDLNWDVCRSQPCQKGAE